MDKEKTIAIIADILSEGYDLDSTVSLGSDTCVVFKRQQRWIYPDTIYLTSFVQDSFLFSSDEFAYRINLSGKPLTPEITIADDCRLISIYSEDDLSAEELEEIGAEIDRAIENDEMYIWDEVTLQIANALILNDLMANEREAALPSGVLPQQRKPSILEKILQVSQNFKQLLFLAGF